MITFSDEVKARVLGNIDDYSNPLVTENGHTYLRYDQMRIEGDSSGWRITYSYRTKVVCSRPFDFYSGQLPPRDAAYCLELTGHDGRIEITIR